MVRESGFSAIGARLEARLNARDLRVKTAETTIKAENISDPLAALFVLPVMTASTPNTNVVSDTDVQSTPVISADHGVGATFRRKGMLSDIPMPVTRVGEGAVFTTFVDGEESHEMAFDPSQIDVVTKAPVKVVANEVEFFPNLIDLVKKATPVEVATPSAPAPAIPVAASPVNADPADAESVAMAGRVLPPSAVVGPDGTIYANLVPNVTPDVPPEFGVGATVRRKGLPSDPPLTVSLAYNGIIRASYTDSRGTRTYEFQANQFELITRAPGT